MVLQHRVGQSNHRWREKHGFVIRMSDQNPNPLVVDRCKIDRKKFGQADANSKEEN
jgi:hypothetical protein